MRCGEKGIGVRDWLSTTVACESVESAGAKSACALWLVSRRVYRDLLLTAAEVELMPDEY